MSKEKNKRRELDNEAKVVLKNIRVSPQKLNLVAQMIRRQTASKAISILQFSKTIGFTMPQPSISNHFPSFDRISTSAEGSVKGK